MLKDSLFLVIFVVLAIIWLVSWLAFHVAGALVHVILVVAAISLILHFLRGRSST